MSTSERPLPRPQGVGAAHPRAPYNNRSFIGCKSFSSKPWPKGESLRGGMNRAGHNNKQQATTSNNKQQQQQANPGRRTFWDARRTRARQRDSSTERRRSVAGTATVPSPPRCFATGGRRFRAGGGSDPWTQRRRLHRLLRCAPRGGRAAGASRILHCRAGCRSPSEGSNSQ